MLMNDLKLWQIYKMLRMQILILNADAGDFMVELSNNKQPIDVVFRNMPRSGSNEKFLISVVKLSPKKVVYIFCNQVT